MADICASWSFSQWGSQLEGESLEEKMQRYRQTAQSDGRSLPATWVALSNGKPAGMASLKNDDHPDLPELSPWLASVYVHPFHRSLGVAAALIKRLERDARHVFGFTKLYLFTGSARGLYEKQGWTFLRHVRDPLGYSPNGDDLMMKEI